jgi:sulfofructose kinase
VTSPKLELPSSLNLASRLLCVGHVALDLAFGVQDFPSQPTKTPAHSFHQGVGGMSANAAVAIARLGAQVRFAGPVGDDASVDVFKAHFRREGVDACGLTPTPGQTSSVSTIVIDARGERMIFNHRGSALSVPPPFNPAWLDQTQVLLTDPRCVAWAEAALREAGRQGVTSLLDGDVAPAADLARLLPLADWVAFSEPGLAMQQPGEPVAALGRMWSMVGDRPQVLLVTLGERGLWWQRRGQPVQHLPAFVVPQVCDTLGAGDTFHGALGLALTQRWDDVTALRFAAAAAALKCQRAPGILGAPRLHEVLALLSA